MWPWHRSKPWALRAKCREPPPAPSRERSPEYPGFQLVAGNRVARAIDKKPTLRTCDGDPSCLAELGRDVGARYVVYGEVGGLGDVEIVYLKVIDVAGARELRSTTVELGGAKSRNRARAAAVLLLAPERYLGRLAVSVDIAGASIYVDGTRVARSPSKALSLSVGTHALRVTHPEFRDFVRFVDIAFDAETAVPVELQKFPIVTSDITRDGQIAGPSNIIYRGVEPTPWYRRWYTVAGFGTVVLVTSGDRGRHYRRWRRRRSGHRCRQTVE